jgi:menaquinone-dependent protoporphyrinogen oxidase
MGLTVQGYAAVKGGTMNKILVAYATKAGSTAEVAEFIGKTLREQGADVDVRAAKDVKDVREYRAAVIGSGIYAGKWLPDALGLIERNREAFREMPVAYFMVCATLKDDTEENRRKVALYSDSAKALAAPVDVGLFGGKIDYARMNFFFRFMLKNMMKAPEGDFRNWEVIRT